MRNTTTIVLLGGLLFTARAEAAEVRVLSAGAARAVAGLDSQEALSEPTRIVWNNPRDPQLARFQETSASCYADAAAYLPASRATGPRGVDSRRQQFWFDCMKTKGYEPREVSGR
jgi:hypothetical protein